MLRHVASVYGKLGRRNCHIRGPKNGQKTGKIDEFYFDRGREIEPKYIIFDPRHTVLRLVASVLGQSGSRNCHKRGLDDWDGLGRWGGGGGRGNARSARLNPKSSYNQVVVQTFRLLTLSRG